ncbi:MAG: ATP-binding cassette domain-containing protein [Bacteroidota bacterium]
MKPFTPPILIVRDVQIRQQQRIIFENVNLEVAKGEFVYLIGKTGSGKSSLLKTLYADLPFDQGQVTLAGYRLTHLQPTDLPHLRRQIGIIFQDFQLFMDRNVADNLSFVLKAIGWKDKVEISHRIDETLEKVGLKDYRFKMPHQLSGGEQQRLAIARAILNDPMILLADEPTGNLDPTVAFEILDLFVEINESGTAVLMATHNHSFLRKHPSRVLYCEDGQVMDIDRELVFQKMTE